MVEIKHRFTGEVMCSGETLRECVTANLKNLRGAYLRDADLRGAYLGGAYLRDADLRDADLRGAYLGGAYLGGADLRDAKLAWQSHDLLAEILRRSAGGDLAKLKVSGLILVMRDKCWKQFAEIAARDPLGGWALDTLAEWVQPDDGAPEIVRERVKSPAACESSN